MSIYDWSTNPANNAIKPGIDWSENMLPSQVNNSARQMMADVASYVASGGGGGGGSLISLKIYNIEDFGAVGDGTITLDEPQSGVGTDNSTAIAAAIAAASAEGGIVWVPAGVFRTTSPSHVLSSDNVHIAGNGTIFFDTADLAVMGRVNFKGGKRVGLNGVAVMGRPGVRCTGLFIDGVYTVDPSRPGYDGSTSLVTFEDCDDYYCTGSELVWSANYGVSTRRSINGRIHGNHPHHLTADGVHVQDGTKDTSILDNVIHHVGDDGIGVGYWGAFNEDITVDGNTIYEIGGRGIAVFGANNSVTLGARNRIRDTFCAPILIEGNAAIEANKINRLVTVEALSFENGGMFEPEFGRSVDVASGIRLNPSGGTIGVVKIRGVSGKNSRNGHVWSEGAGVVEELHLEGGSFVGIPELSIFDYEPTALQGGGKSLAPADRYYPGFKFNNVRKLFWTNTRGEVAHQDGSYVSPVAEYAHIRGVSLTKINAFVPGSDGVPSTGFPTAIAFSSSAQDTLAQGNTLSGSLPSSTLYRIANASLPPTGAIYPDPVITVSDNFNRANVAPTSGGLGNTPVGGKTWVGSAAGITGNQAYFGAVVDQATVFDAGAVDVDVTMTVTVTSAGQRLIARASGTTPGTGAAVIFDSSGNLFHWNGSSIVTTKTFIPATPGVHTMRLQVRGDEAVAWLDGGIVGTLQSAFPITNFVGFQDNSAGLGRFDNFTFSPVAAAITEGGPGLVPIATVTASSGSAITFANVPPKFTDLFVQGPVNTNSGSSCLISVSVDGAIFTNVGSLGTASSNNSKVYGELTSCRLPQGRVSGALRPVADTSLGAMGTSSRNTGPVNHLRISTDSGTFAAGTSITLYGRL